MEGFREKRKECVVLSAICKFINHCSMNTYLYEGLAIDSLTRVKFFMSVLRPITKKFNLSTIFLTTLVTLSF